MDPERQSAPVLRSGAWLCALVAVVHGLTFLGCGPLDDDFIVFRYARSWIQGQGLVFNPGERVEGYTQPLWLLLIAATTRLGIHPVLASHVLSLAASATAVLAVARCWGSLLPGSRWPVPAILLAASPALAFHAIGGLGTTVLAALLGLWLRSYVAAEGSGAATLRPALWLGLAALARPEAVLFCAPFAVAQWRRRPLAGVLSLLPVLSWAVFRWLYYGRLLPVTYHVKKLPLLADLRFGASYLLESTLELGVAVLLVLAVLHVLGHLERGGRALRVTAAGLVLHTGYVVYVGGDYLYLARFFVPTLPLLLLLGCLGARERIGPSLRPAAACLALVALQWPQFQRGEIRAAHARNEVRWSDIGRALARRVSPGSKVAVSAIGAIGYGSGLPIVDTLGMTNLALADVEPDLGVAMKGHHRFDADWVLAQEPDLILLGAGILVEGADRPTLMLFRWEESLRNHPGLWSGYRSMVMPIDGSDPLYFFLRRDAPVPEGAIEAP